MVDTTAPSVPTGLYASPSATAVWLGWSASTDDVGVASYRVRRNGADIPGADAVTGTSYFDMGLTVKTTYSYTVSAVDATGNRSAESSALVVTTPRDAPSSVAASPTGPSTIRVRWAADATATSYRIRQGGVDVSGATALTGTSYVVTGLSPSTTYSFSVSSVDSSGARSTESFVSARTHSTPPPGVPSYVPGSTTYLNDSFVYSSQHSVPVPPGVAVNDVVVVHYQTDGANGQTTVTPPAGFTELAFSPTLILAADTNGELVRQRVFWKRLTAVDTGTYVFNHPTTDNPHAAVNATASAFRGCITTGAPVEVLGSAVQATEGTQTPAVSGTTTAPRTLLYSNAGTSIFAPGVPSTWDMSNLDSSVNSAYLYKPTPGATGTVQPSAGFATDRFTVSLVALVPPPDTTAPTVPSGVSAVANSPTQVTVSWTASTDAIGVASYRVRRGGVDVTGHTADTASPAVITGLSPTTAYSFTVSAVDATGNRSAESTAAPVTTPAFPPVSTLTDNFLTADSAKWDGFDANSSVVSGQLVQQVTSAYNAGLLSVAFYSLVGSSADIQLVQRPNVGNGSTESHFSLELDQNNWLRWITTNNGLVAMRKVAGTATTVVSLTYSGTAHQRLRIRESGGTIFWDTYDGTTWTQRASWVLSGFAVTAIRPMFIAGYWGTETSPGTVIWDNFNVADQQGAGTASGNSNATGAGTVIPAAGGAASVVTNATGAGTVVRPALTLTENWQGGLNASIWAADAALTVSGGRLQIPVGSVYKWIYSQNLYSISNSSLFVDMGRDWTGATSHELVFCLDFRVPGGAAASNLAQMLISGGSVVARVLANNVTTTTKTAAYSPTAHRFMRMRNVGDNNILFETSPDSIVWTTFDTQALPFTTRTALIAFAGGYYGTETASSAYVDNVNLSLQTLQGAGSFSVNSNTTGAGTLTVMSDAGAGSIATDAAGDGFVFNPETTVLYTDLTGRFLTDSGEPVEGVVVLTPGTRYRVDSTYDRIVKLQPREVRLVNGSFLERVPANGSYWRWRADVVQDGSPVRQTLYFVIPMGVETIDIADCVFGAVDTPPAPSNTSVYPGLNRFPSTELYPTA